MKTRARQGLKILGVIIGLLLVCVAIFAAMNFTLLKNLPSSQDGGLDAMYIANQKPLQIIRGAQSHAVPVITAPDGTFSDARKYWEDIGGKALLVWHQGALVFEAYADGVSPEDRSRSFSMHKSVVGLVAATMEADGLIDLDDPVSLYVPAYKKGGREALTIRTLLQHGSGLERYAFNPPTFDALNLLLSDKVEKAAIKAKIAKENDGFDYSNLGYQVAGAALRAALEQKTSQTYAEYLSSRIWSPAGAKDSYLWAETKKGAPRFYAGLQASPRDWMHIGILIAQNTGRVIPQSAVDTVLSPSDINPGYGLGVWLGSPADGVREYGPSTAMTVPSEAPFAIKDTVFFDGFGGQRVYISQEAQLVVVRVGDVRFDWDDTVLPNLVANALKLERTILDEDITLMGADDRAVNVRLLSKDATCDTCKLAVFSHGAFAGDADYDAVVMPLVNAGYHVAIPTHPDSKSHPLNTSFDPQNYAEYRKEDFQLILQYFAQTYGADTPWIAVGHSFGAMIAANFAGATTDTSLFIKAGMGPPTHAVALSPPGVVPGLFTPDAFSALSHSTLLVTGTKDIVPSMIEDWEDHLALYEGAPKDQVVATVFNNQDHYFNGLYGRPVPRARTQADDDLIALMLAFLNDAPLREGDTYRVMP